MSSLIDYCQTEKELEYVIAYEELDKPSFAKAAKAVGKNESTVRRILHRVRNRAAIQGDSPHHDMTHSVPDTHVVKGVSTLYGDEGQVKQQWVKSDLKKDAQIEAFRALVEGMKEDITPVAPVPNTRNEGGDDLLNMYTIADAHLGVLVSETEGEQDFDLQEGETLLRNWFDHMIDASPDASVGLINVIGDMLHVDGFVAKTVQSGHPLDASARFPDIIKGVVRTLRYIVQRALTKHDSVHLVLTTGNHDIASTAWLRELFDALYEDEPRVRVDTSHKMYIAYQFGDVMLGFHHGDRKKGQQLPLLFATDFSGIWGETEFRYIHTGHLHHHDVKEYSGATVEQHSTLTPRDAYAEWNGYRSHRKATTITYHRFHGEVGRTTATPCMLD